MNNHEKAWENANRAVTQLERFLERLPHDDEMVQAAVIQAFEFSFEAVWKLLQKVAGDEGVTVHSPKNALAYGFARNLWESERLCLDMLEDRNRTVHTYNMELAERVVVAVRGRYAAALRNALNALGPSA